MIVAMVVEIEKGRMISDLTASHHNICHSRKCTDNVRACLVIYEKYPMKMYLIEFHAQAPNSGRQSYKTMVGSVIFAQAKNSVRDGCKLSGHNSHIKSKSYLNFILVSETMWIGFIR